MAEDVEVAEFVGWLVTTAKLYGWSAVRSETYGVSGGVAPDVVLFGHGEVLAVKVKTRKAVNASGVRDNGGLTDNQARVRKGIVASGAIYAVWTPEATGEALRVLMGSESPNGANGCEKSRSGALPDNGAAA